MRVSLTFPPLEDDEGNYYHIEFELPAVPRQGDSISIMSPDESVGADFIVRRAWWGLRVSEYEGKPGSVDNLCVECELEEGQGQMTVDLWRRLAYGKAASGKP